MLAKAVEQPRLRAIACLGAVLGLILVSTAPVLAQDARRHKPRAGRAHQGRTVPERERPGHPSQPSSSERFSSEPSSVRLDRSLLVTSESESALADRDRDGLYDAEEGRLANRFRPYCIFDSAENARRSYEPVTLFQVRPLDLRNNANLRIKIKWVFLFRQDGGYGPSSNCTNDHEGDNDTAFYELKSGDRGVTWNLLRIGVGGEGGLEWRPGKSGLKVFRNHHPVIYMSAHKHHEYFTTTYDHKDSFYSRWGCNDDVNGRGDRVLVDLQSVAKPGFYNNVGERGHHPSPTFVNDLGRFYPGHSAWGTKKFYECGPNKDKWMPHGSVGGGGPRGSGNDPPRHRK